MKLVIVDRRFWLTNTWSSYSWHLSREISKLISKPHAVKLYAEKACKGADLPNSPIVKRVWSSPFFTFQIFHELVRDGPDVVHLQFELNTFGSFYINTFLPMLLGLLKLLGLDIVVTMHSVVPRRSITRENIEDLSPKGMKASLLSLKIFFMLLYYTIGKLSSALIVHSKAMKRWLLVDYNLKSEKVFVVPHGVDYATPNVEQSVLDLWNKRLHGKRVLLTFGVVSPRKGLEYLLQAYCSVVKTHRNCILVISGRTPNYYTSYANQLNSLIDSLGLQDKVMFMGPVINEDVYALFSLADMVILPYSHVFSASGVLSLARQYGKPIITTSHEIIVEQVAGWNKVTLVPPKDPCSLADAIRHILNHEDLGVKVSHSQDDSWTNVAEETVKIYNSLIKRRTDAK